MASFLNNSSSRWEAICESWGVKAELVDNISPIYRSDQQRCGLPLLLWVFHVQAGLQSGRALRNEQVKDGLRSNHGAISEVHVPSGAEYGQAWGCSELTI